MNFRKKRPLLGSLLHLAGAGAFFCALSCTLIGCGSSKETISENEKKLVETSSIPPKPQNEPDRKKAVNVISRDGINEIKIPPEMMESPAGDGVAGKDYSGPVETIPAFFGETALSPRELHELRRSTAMIDIDLDAVEALPPDSPGGSGITYGEFKARAQSLSAGLTDLDGMEVIPPSELGGRGMTLGEMKALNSLAGQDFPPPDFPPMMPPNEPVGTGK